MPDKKSFTSESKRSVDNPHSRASASNFSLRVFIKHILGFRSGFADRSNLRLSIKRILGFRPDNIHLYQQAFFHRSAGKRNILGLKLNNERLEYLGDSILSAVVASYLFRRYPNKNEGFLTEMRSKIVSRESLNKIGRKMHLSELITTSSQPHDMFSHLNGDAVEALLGAIFLDKGYRFTEEIIIKHLLAHYIDIDEVERREWNFKGKLIDWGQHNRQSIAFHTLSVIPLNGHKRLYRVGVTIDGKHTFVGESHSIKSAEQAAAETAYKEHVSKNLPCQFGT
ncbi:MAG: ribonuclease III [Bacteroidales bacterium]|jgi:ribonuclease-3|nr:ribonuclease III [Bacteroidales bacterium]